MYQIINAYGEVVRDNMSFTNAVIFCKEMNDDDYISQANKPFIVMKQED